ncbi:PREDICTED: uncharacterized protein LOC104783564 [Camelina sativa]|uniref:Uncharacterized protein LOC104783564 n=1 Tax=Camelina sativa TaxID=90675 RepID=A0ABM0YWR1_CAMSA|nr:PREDICTED: uncharacterized protein LOC104783564 [Camelina sativa]
MAASPISNDKPFGIAQIKAYIPISLDMRKLKYDKWRELFETHCLSFGVLGHLDGSSSSTPATAKEWKERDGLVKMWIYGTISESILDTVLKKNASAHEFWLSNLKVISTTADLLANIDSPVTDRVLVMHLLNGLSDKFDSIINVIKHRTPFPGFLEARSMLHMEEDRLSKMVKSSPSHHDTPSSSTILYTNSDGSSRSSSNNTNNFGRGSRHRNRGGGRSRGRGRFNNNWPPNSYASSWY